MKKVLRKFGRYLLLDHLAQGGMAEVFRAWAPSVDGGGRLIVLKCVQPNLGQDTEFLQMFRSEIRVSIGLNHPNIVQLYDFGEVDGRPYIAMELVEGKSLKQIIQHLAHQSRKIPVAFTAYAIEQVAAGLHYAHTYRDRTSGEDLSIVHRDVSPQNLLVSYSGNVKIIDFGIAKAASNRQTTRAGIIKGKPSYLSPEQISGEVLDGRSDVFSLGAVFWEALTGRKLFSGDSDLAAIKLIDNCDDHVTPPSTLNPEVPPEIDSIVLKSLTHDRNKRFKNAEELQRALHRAIYAFNPEFDPSDFANFLGTAFEHEIEQDQKDLQILNSEAKILMREDSFSKVPSLEISKEDSEKIKDQMPDAPEDAEESTTSQTLEASIPPTSKKKPLKLSPDDSGVRYYDTKGPELAKIDLQMGVLRKPSRVDYDPTRDTEKSSRLPKAILAVVALCAAGYYFIAPQPGSRPQTQSPQGTKPVAGKQAPPSAPQAAAPVAPPVAQQPAVQPVAQKFATLRLDLNPSGGAVSLQINGTPMDPSQVIQLPLGMPLTFVIGKEGFKPVTKTATLTAAGDYPIQLDLEPTRYGLLTLHTTPTAKVQLTMNDLVWTLSSPIDSMKLPPGSYQARMVNELLGMEKSASVEVLLGKSMTQEVELNVKK